MSQLSYSAVSDVGRVRKDNQDSGYAGPWLLAVCDGVGGAARGDVASATAIAQVRRLDVQPGEETDLLGAIAGALHRAHDRIAELVDDDPALTGTSTTAVVGVFDGTQLAMGHIGDSRAYRLRGGVLEQLTHDHTFVQSLVDEGRITADEARTHPHRNLILKAIDSVQEVDPDLFLVDLEVGDRILVCSDGILTLEDDRIAGILGEGNPDYAAIELCRASLEAGSTDNVTAVVAEVVEDGAAPDDLEPLLVGAAADLPRKAARGAGGPRRFRGHRSGDTGEIEPIQAEIADAPPRPATPVDPETARYAPRSAPRHRWLRVLSALMVLLGLAGMVAGYGRYWAWQQYYVGQQDGVVTIYRGVQGDLLGFRLSEPFETTNLELDRLSTINAERLCPGTSSGTLDEARQTVRDFWAQQLDPDEPDSGATC